MPAEIAVSAALKIAANIIPHIAKDAVVAGYYPMRGELDVLPLLRQLSARGNKICLPVIAGGTKILQFLAWSPDAPLCAGKYGVLCPPDNSPALMPDVIIAPLVGFDAAGWRMGYGGGYYDATISELRAQNKSVQIIGAAYSMQLVESLPHEAHDERLGAVATELSYREFNLPL